MITSCTNLVTQLREVSPTKSPLVSLKKGAENSGNHQELSLTLPDFVKIKAGAIRLRGVPLVRTTDRMDGRLLFDRLTLND